MRQEIFETTREDSWKRFEALLARLEKIGAPASIARVARGSNAPTVDEFPALYRALCQDLALARERHFSAWLIERLNQLALRGHEQLYGSQQVTRQPVTQMLRALPIAVYSQRKILLFVTVLFFGVLAWSTWRSYEDPSFAYSVLGQAGAQSYEEMHSGDDKERTADDSSIMFGFYIFNNITIDFRAFASGLLLGIGSLFFIVYNALSIGAVMGHLARVGSGHTLASFVIGHGAFELPSLIVSAAAGVALGLTWVAPGPRSRLSALRVRALEVLPLVAAAGVMGVIAAGLEAFWSPLPIPRDIKYAVGAVLWTGVIGSFVLLGIRRAA